MSTDANPTIEPKEVVVHVVWAVRYPGPKFRAVSELLGRREAVNLVAQEWSQGVMARLEPPLRASARKKG